VAKRTLKVAVTGPTGDIGRPFLRALERSPQVAEIRGMARRPFDPQVDGLKRTSYVQGDILEPDDLDRLVDGVDVVVHLAFIIFGSAEETRAVNLRGSRHVFDAAVASGAKRLVYTSSVAAYGFHDENPQPLTEEVPVAGTDDFYYSAQKAELEDTLAVAIAGSGIEPYVFRPSIVGGPESLLLIENLPYVRVGQALPGALRSALGALPGVKPVLPDTGTPLQLVHSDDVGRALTAAVVGRGQPGAYNLAAPGQLRMRDIADELGWATVPVPPALLEPAAFVLPRIPFAPSALEWLHTMRTPVVMDTSKARAKLRWRPKFDARDTLRQTVGAARARGLL
jgi:nucleoside-diphosphate-sugar epimerase